MKTKLILLFLIVGSICFGQHVYYVAPTGGSDSNAGTNINAPWATWQKAFNTADAGDTVYFRGGVWYPTASIQIAPRDGIGHNGEPGNPIYYFNYPNEVPILDCKNLVAPAANPLGDGNRYVEAINLTNLHWVHFKGLTIRNVFQRDQYVNARGILGNPISNIIFENMTVHDISGAGYYMFSEVNIMNENYGWGSLTHIPYDTTRYINCDVYNVCDSLPSNVGNDPGNMADGFKTLAGSEGFISYEGCRAWGCSDDGFDNVMLVVTNCWAFDNYNPLYEGNGFKPASSQFQGRTQIFNNNIIVNCDHGIQPIFYDIVNPDPVHLLYYNNLFYKCNVGFSVTDYDPDYYDYDMNIFNNIIYDTQTEDSGGRQYIHDITKNYVEGGNNFSKGDAGSLPDWVPNSFTTSITDDDFVSLDVSQLRRPRKTDGSLPYITFGRLKETSECVGAGVYVGMSANPDMGIDWAYLDDSQIIADHTVVDKYDDIPQYWIDEVKKMWVSYPGESHAAAILKGLELIEALNSTYDVNITDYSTWANPEAYTTAHLRASTAMWGNYANPTGWQYFYGEGDWWTNPSAVARTKASLSYCNTTGPSLSAVGFGWCWDATRGNISENIDPVTGNHWYGTSENGPSGDRAWGIDNADNAITGNVINMDTYINATQSYIDYCTTNSIPTKVFFTTGPVDDWEGNISNEALYQGHLKWQHLRDYITSNPNTILFDYADILCYNDAGILATNLWSGHTYPTIHPDNNLYNSTYTGHIGYIGALRLGKAMWWMLARIAGWDGLTEGAASTATDIAGFTLAAQTGAATINTTNHTVAIEVDYTADITNLTPTITLSYGATVIPASGTARDFSNPVPYTVTAEDGVTYQEWTVTVTQEAEPVTPVPTGGAIVKFNGKIVKR